MTQDPTERFVQDVMAHQQGLYTYILSLVHRVPAADDVLQEVNLVLWRKRDTFESGTNFKAWAYRIAHNQVLAYRKKHAIDRHHFDDELINRLGTESIDRSDRVDPRRAALAGCLDKLPAADRELIQHRYDGDDSIQALSGRVGRSANAIYQALHRIRTTLLGCIQKTISSGERA